MSGGHQLFVATGRLGDDPEVAAPQSGGLVAKLRIAVTDTFSGRNNERTDHTEWLRVKVFGRTAEIAQNYLQKGRLVTVQGKLRTEKWQAPDGSDRYSTWIYATVLEMHGGGGESRSGAEHQGRPREQARPSTHLSPPARNPAPEFERQDDFADDDIPF